MHQSPFALLSKRRFLPLFITQFLGAFNDNLFKNALVILVTYRLADQSGENPQIMVTLAAGLFILPFFLFSATAGQLADKLEKSRLVRLVKFSEIIAMALASVGFAIGNSWFLLTVLFLMGTQSAFFGPLKYAILPDHLSEEELLGGNALIEAGTFLAILLGTLAGGVLVLREHGMELVSTGLLGIAVAGWLASLALPPARIADPSIRINPNFLAETWAILRLTAGRRGLFLAVLGISWFWLLGATYLSQFPTYVKDVLHADENVVTLFLILFSVGIGLGSLLCNTLLDGAISARHVPFAALGMSLFTVDLYFASRGGESVTGPLLTIAGFVADAQHWRIMADLLLIAICGGVYVVPLYAILQTRSEQESRSRAIAGNNVMNALFMVVSAMATLAMLHASFTIPQVFLTVGLVNLVVAFYICGLLPDAVLRGIFSTLFRLLYRVELRGWENFAQAGPRSVIVVNHVSFLDAALLAAFLPEKAAFAVNTHIARAWWVKPFLQVVEAIPLDPTNPFAIKTLARLVQEGRHCVIFPEGRITVTGALMKIYEGPGVIADRAQAPLIPVRIEGAQFTPFSRLRGKLRLRWFPKITLTMLPPRRIELPEELKGRERRQRIGLELYDLLSEMIFQTTPRDRTLFDALQDARALHGPDHPILEDSERVPMGYQRLVTGSFVLGRKMARETEPGAAVGILLPNAAVTATLFFGLHAVGRVPAMLNYSTGLSNLLSACTTARIATVITSRRFLAMARLEETGQALEKSVRVLYLEEVRSSIGTTDRLSGMTLAWWSRFFRWKSGRKPEDPAVILFTSGSEGTPKGVVLSHANLLSNCAQLSARVDYTASDIVFNALPVFHSFGLTGGLLLPVLSGIRVFLYPSPLHYRIVPEAVYDTNATILFGTDTFLAGYARMAQPYDFYSVRYVFAGAERVKESTRRVWEEKFGLRIFEGYGATETSPALTTNTPMHCRIGSVGRFLPGIRHRLDAVPGIPEGGRLVVAGPNVMLGYLKAERPGVIQPPADGEYDTGDIVKVDGEGFVTILGRAKRFAKIAGEMVSLGAVEELAQRVWPGRGHAAAALPDPRKGEQVILLTDQPDATREALLNRARADGVAELMVPRQVRVVPQIPLLGSGKTDTAAVQRMAAELSIPVEESEEEV